ncbi:hypothetical protein TEA_024733 [Camellia sinensis var. sinensis]|uniref:F-box domain-containing protein n=1 Tax=Camellia sinensis var. sinensis TaxID=542762 RepID=A0A4S4EGG2_CAMSN|nr:hypothetical protein TEA_024733 [Camellia sinensis var. sinensis]
MGFDGGFCIYDGEQRQKHKAKKTYTKRRNLIVGSTSSDHSPASELIAGNVGLLSEILFRLPPKSLIRFKSVSKDWWSNTNTTILHSCNGLLLCLNGTTRFIVCNPTTKKHKILPYPVGISSSCFVKQFSVILTESGPIHNNFDAYLAFDPSKSPHYKVVLNNRLSALGFKILRMAMDRNDYNWVVKYRVNLRPLRSVFPELADGYASHAFSVFLEIFSEFQETVMKNSMNRVSGLTVICICPWKDQRNSLDSSLKIFFGSIEFLWIFSVFQETVMKSSRNRASGFTVFAFVHGKAKEILWIPV